MFISAFATVLLAPYCVRTAARSSGNSTPSGSALSWSFGLSSRGGRIFGGTEKNSGCVRSFGSVESAFESTRIAENPSTSEW